HGALMLTTQGDDIDQMVGAERVAILKVGGVASAVMIMLSLLLASTIAGPVRRLADGAERVRRRIQTRVEIPDFTRRRDEIGHLSGALRRLLTTLASVANATRLGNDVTVEARFEGRSPTDAFSVPGHDSRLGQVISNLLSNAQSFSKAGGKVRIVCRRVRSEIEIIVD